MNPCERLKKTLVATGQDGIEHDAALAAHLKDCAVCRRLLQAWAQIPELLGQLPARGPEQELVQKVKQAVADTGRSAARRRRRFLAPSLASAAVLLAAIGLSRELLLPEAPKTPVTMEIQEAPGQLARGPAIDSTGERENDALGHARKQEAADNAPPLERARPDYFQAYRVFDGDAERKPDNGRFAETSSVALSQPETPAEEFRHSRAGSEESLADANGELKKGADKNIDQLADHESAGTGKEAESAVDAHDLLTTDPAPKEMGRIQATETEAPRTSTDGGADGYARIEADGTTIHAFDFLGHYQQTANLRFQPATGYWSNIYIPGDPEIRWLSARLAQWDRSWLRNNAGLERHVAPVKQPFDAPEHNALSLSLMADANAVRTDGNSHEPTRMRLQVGIRGIEHRRGQRPAMNVGVVVDLPADAPDAVRIASRALLDALLQSKQPGDRFSLVLTSQPGKTRGLAVAADDFRFGPLQLVQQVILGQDTASAQPAATRPDTANPDLSSLDLYGAIRYAGLMVQENDDPGRPLGSSAIMLISAREIDHLERLITLTHERAKEGITLSVFPLGVQAQGSQADQLVLAGLGNRRFLEEPGQARQLVEEELHASSRAVARAARLSIRLAPGVQLIGVVGSQRLDTERAQRVRDIENSMDRRLSANLGIQADRGEDEDGIQILIPSIYSADSVTVLLDVVTDRPGAIADVSLRYKDLVFLRNGRLQGHLELPEGELRRGAAELAVLKNLLAHHFVAAVRQAAAALGRQQADEAAGILRAMHATIGQARQSLTAWTHDPDLIHDQQVLDRYIAALASPQAGDHRSFLTDSLQYAAWAKTHRGLEEWKQ